MYQIVALENGVTITIPENDDHVYVLWCVGPNGETWHRFHLVWEAALEARKAALVGGAERADIEAFTSYGAVIDETVFDPVTRVDIDPDRYLQAVNLIPGAGYIEIWKNVQRAFPDLRWTNDWSGKPHLSLLDHRGNDGRITLTIIASEEQTEAFLAWLREEEWIHCKGADDDTCSQ